MEMKCIGNSEEDVQPKGSTTEEENSSKQNNACSKGGTLSPQTMIPKKCNLTASSQGNGVPSGQYCGHINVKADIHTDTKDRLPFQCYRKIVKSQSNLQIKKHHTVAQRKHRCVVVIEKQKRRFSWHSQSTERKTKLIELSASTAVRKPLLQREVGKQTHHTVPLY